MQLAIANNNESFFLCSLTDRANKCVVQATRFGQSGQLGFYSLQISRDECLDLSFAAQAHNAGPIA